jgi:hypothetical protein
LSAMCVGSVVGSRSDGTEWILRLVVAGCPRCVGSLWLPGIRGIELIGFVVFALSNRGLEEMPPWNQVLAATSRDWRKWNDSYAPMT